MRFQRLLPQSARYHGYTVFFSMQFCNHVCDTCEPIRCEAMAFTALFSSVFLEFSMGFHSAAGYLVSFLSMCLYYTPSEVLLSTDVELLAQVTAGREKDKSK